MLLTIILSFMTSWARASEWKAVHEGVWDTHAHAWIQPEDLRPAKGEIWVFGEEHASTGNAGSPSTFIHHQNQIRLLKSFVRQLQPVGASVSVGMEFLEYPKQAQVDLYRAGTLPEADFLKSVGWGTNPYEFYRPLVQFQGGGKTVALNIPASIAAQVAKLGPEGLSLAERGLLPPVWNRGNADYFERFSSAMGNHVPADKLEKYFLAQSLWDDTMAWKALEYHHSTVDDVLMIVVGAFHVEFGGGLPFELRAQGATAVRTIVQAETADWEPANLQDAIADDPKYGARADYIWVHSGSVSSEPVTAASHSESHWRR